MKNLTILFFVGGMEISGGRRNIKRSVFKNEIISYFQTNIYSDNQED